MNPARSLTSSRRFHFLAWPILLALTACSSAVTSAKLQQIHPGMKPAEVTALLGAPTHIEHAEITGLTGDVYYYPARNGTARVVFVDDSVFTTALDANRQKPL